MIYDKNKKLQLFCPKFFLSRKIFFLKFHILLFFKFLRLRLGFQYRYGQHAMVQMHGTMPQDISFMICRGSGPKLLLVSVSSPPGKMSFGAKSVEKT